MLSVKFTVFLFIYRICIKKNSTILVRIFFLESGVVIDLCELLKIKLKNSRPYHPQRQGKVERSHGTWKKKLEFDMKQENSKAMTIKNNIFILQVISSNCYGQIYRDF